MTAPVRLDPDAFYDAAALRRALGIRLAPLTRARKEGRIRCTRKGGRFLFLGRWVHEWLTADPAPSEPLAVAS